MRTSSKIFVFSLVLLCCSCSRATLSPVEYVGILTSAKNLLSLCVLLLSTADMKYIKLVIPRLYYAYYYLARLVYHNRYGFELSNHTHTWNGMNPSIKQWGIDLKAKRLAVDYRPFDVSNADVIDDLRQIAGGTLFDDLCDELMTTLPSGFESEQLQEATNSLRAEHDSLIEGIQRLEGV